jgi:hypothetical protein
MEMKLSRSIDKDYFIKRLVTLCWKSGLSDFPKDIRDQHIILKSIMLAIEPSRIFTEQEINEHIKIWMDSVCHIKGLDQVTLRRRLIDTGYLKRTKDGATYQVSASGPHSQFFDESVDQLDIASEIDKARQEIERKKREFLYKKK